MVRGLDGLGGAERVQAVIRAFLTAEWQSVRVPALTNCGILGREYRPIGRCRKPRPGAWSLLAARFLH